MKDQVLITSKSAKPTRHHFKSLPRSARPTKELGTEDFPVFFMVVHHPLPMVLP
jgi:hypothetical protein